MCVCVGCVSQSVKNGVRQIVVLGVCACVSVFYARSAPRRTGAGAALRGGGIAPLLSVMG